MSTKIADAVTPALLEHWWGGGVKEYLIGAILIVLAIGGKLLISKLTD